MAKVLRVNKDRHRPGIYDSDTGVSCQTEKIVDITEDCPNIKKNERAILLFTRETAGRIVKIVRADKREISFGTESFFFVENLMHDTQIFRNNFALNYLVELFGITKLQLRSLIEAHVPA